VTAKNVKLVGKGFLGLVDNIFWHLPFVSPKQAHAVREKAHPAVTEEDWKGRSETIKADLAADGAREQLAAACRMEIVVGCKGPSCRSGAGGRGRGWRRRGCSGIPGLGFPIGDAMLGTIV